MLPVTASTSIPRRRWLNTTCNIPSWHAETVTFPDGTTDTELFDDDDVHNVLYNSGFSARKFSNSNQDSECV